jgi:hypothetical protein
VYVGWPAVYQYFAEHCGWTPVQTNECPLYLGCILMGALSPDHEGLRLSANDFERYYGSKRRGN